jgi:uncharacterized membrane protein YhaH (DUF805 family)
MVLSNGSGWLRIELFPFADPGTMSTPPCGDASKVLRFLGDNATLLLMKMLLRAIVFLAMLFVVLYVGVNNTHSIEFSFPLLLTKKIQATAAIVYFAVFAVGVVAGLALGSSGGKNKPRSEGKKPA